LKTFCTLLSAFNKNNSIFQFMYVDIGTEGGSNDAGIFSRCSLKAALDSGELNLPDIAHEDPLQVKYHLLGDDAFGLTDTLMKPYPNKSNEAKERVFNFRCTIKSNSVIGYCQ
jgi:hypothetical protein